MVNFLLFAFQKTKLVVIAMSVSVWGKPLEKGHGIWSLHPSKVRNLDLTKAYTLLKERMCNSVQVALTH